METTTTSPVYSASCVPYCNANGVFKPGLWCFDVTDPVFCCGSRLNRYCCNDPRQDIDGIYPPMTESDCSPTDWWIYNWRIIMALLCTLMMLLLTTTCCYYCCKTPTPGQRRRSRNTAAGNGEVPTVSSATDGRTFDPASPNAFSPPAYDSVAKDPPSYLSLYGDIIQCDDPPPFSNSQSSTTPGITCHSQSERLGIQNMGFIGDTPTGLAQSEIGLERAEPIANQSGMPSSEGQSSMGNVEQSSQISIIDYVASSDHDTVSLNANEEGEIYHFEQDVELNTSVVTDNTQGPQLSVTGGFVRVSSQLSLNSEGNGIVI